MKILKYLELTNVELLGLDRGKVVFFSAISPLETHGPHLPIGTDILIAESLRDNIIESVGKRRPDITPIILPTIPLGADAIPVKGSIKIRHQSIMNALTDFGESLSKLGFKYWLLVDNHGGPSHQIGIELASRKLAEKNFHLIPPFNGEFRQMVDHDPELLEKTGLSAETCGGCEDSHAGTNETSMMLALHPDKVRAVWKELKTAKTSPMKLPASILAAVGNILSSLGAHDAAVDMKFLSLGLAWVSDPDMDPYQGNPSSASEEAGRAMLKYREDYAIHLLESAMSGNRIFTKPLGWSVRLLKNFM